MTNNASAIWEMGRLQVRLTINKVNISNKPMVLLANAMHCKSSQRMNWLRICIAYCQNCDKLCSNWHCKIYREAIPGPWGPSELMFFEIFFRILRIAAMLSDTKLMRLVMSSARSRNNTMPPSTRSSCSRCKPSAVQRDSSSHVERHKAHEVGDVQCPFSQQHNAAINSQQLQQM